MKPIQFVSLVAGVIIFLISLKKYKERKYAPRDFVLWLIVSFSLIIISIALPLVNFILPLLSMTERAYFIFTSSILMLFILIFLIYLKITEIACQIGILNLELTKIKNKGLKKKRKKSEKPLVDIIIPAYNEERNIELLLKEISQMNFPFNVEVIVVDDGSTDNTAKIASKYGALVIRHEINRGQGDAFRTGYMLALERNPDVIVSMDADGQHNPKDLPKLVEPIIKGEAEFVKGSRFLDGGGQEVNILHRTLGIKFFNFMINFFSGLNLTDSMNGYIAYNPEALKRLRLKERQYRAPELFIEIARNNFKILEVPIKVRKRKLGKSKKGELKYLFHLIRVSLNTWLRR